MKKDKNTEAFFALLRAGLWEKETRLSTYGDIDYSVLLNLAEEQSVVGLIAAGLNHVSDIRAPQEMVLQFVGEALQIEQQNTAMNSFIGRLIDEMRNVGIYTLLIKGQGVAQCYEKPLWRSSGDVDFLLSGNNYVNAREYLRPLIDDGYNPNDEKASHISAKLSSWDIELHANQSCGLSRKMDKGIREIQNALFYEGDVRSWIVNGVQVFVPGADNNVILVFTHFLKHFYRGGLGLRQICDWCRVLWTYKDSLDQELLESRLRKMGLMSEWRAFAAFAVDNLGMPVEAMPFYSSKPKWSRKAKSICSFVMTVGNMGHNRDISYYESKTYLVRKAISMGMRISDLIGHAMIFPMDSLRFFPKMMFDGLRSAMKGY